MPLNGQKREAKVFPQNEGKKLLGTQSMYGGINMKNQRMFNVKLTYNEIMAMNRAIDDFVVKKNIKGIDTTKDRECTLLHKIKWKIINAYM